VPVTLPNRSLPHLDNAPLKVALAQVRFPTVLAIERPAEVSSFQECLGEAYELAERQLTQHVRVFVGEKILDAPQPPVAEPLFRFVDREHGRWVALSSSSLGFEASTYQKFEDFASEFRRVLSHLVDLFRPKTQTRLGLRYINEIIDGRLAAKDFTALIASPLVSPIGPELGTDVESSLNEIRFRQPDGRLVLRHGLVNEDTYLLDFDYFNENEVPFDLEHILAQTQDYHSVIESLFVWSLSPSYFEELRGGKR
jgi:uncharacterized protein (TIGR04255 family)